MSLASAQEQFRILLDNMDETYMSLTNVLQETDVYDRGIAREEQQFFSDCYGPNAAWCWSNGNRLELCHFEVGEEFRKWGYVMWDKERLNRCGVLDQDNEQYLRTMYI